MPLIIEVQRDQEWVQLTPLRPTDRPGSISHNDGTRRDVYTFKCREDDLSSIIEKSRAGIDKDLETDDTARTLLTIGMEVVKVLKDGESHELNIKTDKSPCTRRMRFTHRTAN